MDALVRTPARQNALGQPRWYAVAVLLSVCLTGRIYGQEFEVAPEKVELVGRFAQSQLVVRQQNATSSQSQWEDLTPTATYGSTNPAVASVSPQGQVRGLSNGECHLSVTIGNTSRVLPVVVSGVDEKGPISFNLQVLPVLSKAGCNAGACHASQFGKGGFKLSVFAFDPDADYAAIVRDCQGRRADMIEPANSLFLLKPTMAIPHGGNRRIEPQSPDSELLKAWLKNGAARPDSNDPKVVRVQVHPTDRLGAGEFSQQLRVVAVYSDQQTRDVTHWAKFDSLDDGLLRVTPRGRYTMSGKGQTGVLVRFEGQAAVATAMVPFASTVDLANWKDQNYIDTIAAKKFAQLGLRPSPLCDDATFMRRAYLDVLGKLPSVQECTDFLDSTDPDKRAKLVDRLLGLTGDPAQDIYGNEYASFWALRWADLIRSSSDNLGEQGMWSMHNWLREAFRANKPFDLIARELVTAKGSVYREGPANYFRIASNPEDLAESTAQLFLGVRLQCAKCHHHPFEKYGQDDYYGFAAIFARIGTKGSQEFGVFGGESIVFERTSGEVSHPKTGKIMVPKPLDGAPQENAANRRVALADWLAAKDNPYFAWNIANRYVAYLLGSGLVEPVDDMRGTNPPSNQELLNALANDFIANGYNVRHLLRTILNSRLYQLDAQPVGMNAQDRRFYSHFQARRIGAEPLLDAIDEATGSRTKFPNLPLGTRAIDLPDSNYPNYFLKTFGKPRRVSVCECERPKDANLAQALHTLNSDVIEAKIIDPNGRVAKFIASNKPLEEALTELYLATLSRRPTPEEVAAWRELAKDAPDLKTLYEDVLWTLLNSKQFLHVQ